MELAKDNLEKHIAKNHLQATKYTETIQRIAEELVAELLETQNLQKTLEEIVDNPATLNLLAASQQKLQTQIVNKIKDNFVHYFPNLHLDPILEKINNDIVLSDEEIAKFPS